MPDPSAGVATGLYWVATGKTPLDDLNNDDELKAKPENSTDDPNWHPANKKDRK